MNDWKKVLFSDKTRVVLKSAEVYECQIFSGEYRTQAHNAICPHVAGQFIDYVVPRHMIAVIRSRDKSMRYLRQTGAIKSIAFDFSFWCSLLP